jgi:hypothetical protein
MEPTATTSVAIRALYFPTTLGAVLWQPGTLNLDGRSLGFGGRLWLHGALQFLHASECHIALVQNLLSVVYEPEVLCDTSTITSFSYTRLPVLSAAVSWGQRGSYSY